MDYTAFSHGQMHSKQWLCEKLEPLIDDHSRLLILGSWYNLLGFMLCSRKNKKYNCITGIDKDPNAIQIANKICEPWMIHPDAIIQNKCIDANLTDMNGYDVIINCSCEHMDNIDWFHNIPKNTLVCLQSSDIGPERKDWNILNFNPCLEAFITRYPLSSYYFKDEINFVYESLTFKRFMIIGKK